MPNQRALEGVLRVLLLGLKRQDKQSSEGGPREKNPKKAEQLIERAF